MEFAESGVISLRRGRMSAARRLRSADRALRRSPEVALRVLTSPQKNLVASRRARKKCRFQGAVRDIMGATMLGSRETRVRLAIAAAASFIAISGLSEASSPFDYDDGDGVFEPWELGFQVWENGSRVLLAMGPSSKFFGRTRSYSSGAPIVG